MRRVVIRVGAALCMALALAAVPGPARAGGPPPPQGSFVMTLSSASVDFGGVDPDVPVSLADALEVEIRGFKTPNGTLEFSYDATDFINSDPGAETPTMPVGVMSYAVAGDETIAEKPMVSSEHIASEVVDKVNWSFTYTFGYAITAPFEYEAGSYAADIMYTAVLW